MCWSQKGWNLAKVLLLFPSTAFPPSVFFVFMGGINKHCVQGVHCDIAGSWCLFLLYLLLTCMGVLGNMKLLKFLNLTFQVSISNFVQGVTRLFCKSKTKVYNLSLSRIFNPKLVITNILYKYFVDIIFCFKYNMIYIYIYIYIYILYYRIFKIPLAFIAHPHQEGLASWVRRASLLFAAWWHPSGPPKWHVGNGQSPHLHRRSKCWKTSAAGEGHSFSTDTCSGVTWRTCLISDFIIFFLKKSRTAKSIS
jgi:hypothetical protein